MEHRQVLVTMFLALLGFQGTAGGPPMSVCIARASSLILSTCDGCIRTAGIPQHIGIGSFFIPFFFLFFFFPENLAKQGLKSQHSYENRFKMRVFFFSIEKNLRCLTNTSSEMFSIRTFFKIQKSLGITAFAVIILRRFQ